MSELDHAGFRSYSRLLACAALLFVWGCAEPNLWPDVDAGPRDPSDPSDPRDDDPGPGPGDDPWDPRDDDEERGPTHALPSCFDELAPGGDDGGDPADGADAGELCEVTEDCREPLICLEGLCVGPGEEGAWCDGIDIVCPYDGSTCVGGWCVFTDGACSQNLDCPAGYLCVDGQCVPAEGDCYTDDDCPADMICDYGECVDPAGCMITQDLRGRFSARSMLRLGEAAGGFLQAMEWIRNLLLGEGHIPDTLAMFDDIVLSVLNTYLVPWEREVIIALGDINDLLDNTVVDHTIDLDAECRELYRGSITVDHVELEFRGTVLSGRPEDIPMVGPIPPAEFGARLRCDTIAIDEFRISHLMAGLLRWLADGITQSASRGDYMTVEEAMMGVIDCSRITERIMSEYPILGIGFDIACEIALSTAVAAVTEALTNPVEANLMRLSGVADVPSSDRLTNGHWSGSFGIGDFTGEFSADRL